MHGMSGEKAIISNLISGMAGRTWKLYEMLCNPPMLGNWPPERGLSERVFFFNQTIIPQVILISIVTNMLASWADPHPSETIDGR